MPLVWSIRARTTIPGDLYAAQDGRVIAMSEALEIDPTLREIADLPPGWTARRTKVGGSWQKVPGETAEPPQATDPASPSCSNFTPVTRGLYGTLGYCENIQSRRG